MESELTIRRIIDYKDHLSLGSNLDSTPDDVSQFSVFSCPAKFVTGILPIEKVKREAVLLLWLN